MGGLGGWRIEVEDEYDQNKTYACMKLLKISLNDFMKKEEMRVFQTNVS